MTNNSTPQSDIYDHHYFENECGGHKEYHEYMGDVLPPWSEVALSIAKLKSGDVVLDIGSGRGEISYRAAQKDCLAIGLDYSLAAINISQDLRQKAIRKGKPFYVICADARYIPLPSNRFDYIFMLDIVEHLSEEDLAQVFSQASKLLKPGGQIIIHTMPNLNYYRWGYPVYRFLMRIFGKELPKDPRKRFYHGECHVNIQTPRSLRMSLERSKFVNISVKLDQLSGSKLKKAFCRFFPMKYVLANDIIATGEKEQNGS